MNIDPISLKAAVDADHEENREAKAAITLQNTLCTRTAAALTPCTEGNLNVSKGQNIKAHTDRVQGAKDVIRLTDGEGR